MQWEPSIVATPEFQNLVEGWGEIGESILDCQSLVCETTLEIPILDQGSVAKPLGLETKELVSPQQVPRDFGILEYYWRLCENMVDTTSMIEFPIDDTHGGAPINPIYLSSFPILHGITTEDPDPFMFDFDLLC